MSRINFIVDERVETKEGIETDSNSGSAIGGQITPIIEVLGDSSKRLDYTQENGISEDSEDLEEEDMEEEDYNEEERNPDNNSRYKIDEKKKHAIIEMICQLEEIRLLSAGIYGGIDAIEQSSVDEDDIGSHVLNEKENIDNESNDLEEMNYVTDTQSDTTITEDEIGELLPINSKNKQEIYNRIDQLVEKSERIRKRRQNMERRFLSSGNSEMQSSKKLRNSKEQL